MSRPAAAWRLPVGIVAIAVVVRLMPAALTYGTSDVMTWELLGRAFLAGENFYATQLHNWPVLWIYFCAAAVTLSDATGLPLSTLVKVPPIAADACIAVLLYQSALRRAWPTRSATLAGLAYALNPVAILITGYHGQFDAMMLAPTVLAWYLWESPIWRLTSGISSSLAPYFATTAAPTNNLTTSVTPAPTVTKSDTPLPATAAAQSDTALPATVASHSDVALPPTAAAHSDIALPPTAAAHPDITRRATLAAQSDIAPPAQAAAHSDITSGAATPPVTDAPQMSRVTPGVTVPVTPPPYHRGWREGGGGANRTATERHANSRTWLWTSALALGVGIWFKPVPLLLLPVLLPRLRSWRDRVLFTLLACAPATLGTFPYFLRWPEDVATNFLGYSSWFGQWGYPVVWMILEYISNGTIPWWLPDPDHVSTPLHFMYVAGRYVLVLALFGTWWLAYRRRMDVLRSIVATFSVFYFATSGFGVQYLLWIVPFAVARRDRWLWPFTATATLTLLVAYTLGLAYLPLPVSPDNGPSTREFVVKLATLPTWVVTGLWSWSLLRRHHRAEH